MQLRGVGHSSGVSTETGQGGRAPSKNFGWPYCSHKMRGCSRCSYLTYLRLPKYCAIKYLRCKIVSLVAGVSCHLRSFVPSGNLQHLYYELYVSCLQLLNL